MPRLGGLLLACLLVALASAGPQRGAAGTRLPRSPGATAAAAAAAAGGPTSAPASWARRLLADSAADGGFLQLASQNGSASECAATDGRSASQMPAGAATNGHTAAPPPLPEPVAAPLPATRQPEPAAEPAAEPATQREEQGKSLGQKLGSVAAGADGNWVLASAPGEPQGTMPACLDCSLPSIICFS